MKESLLAQKYYLMDKNKRIHKYDMCNNIFLDPFYLKDVFSLS